MRHLFSKLQKIIIIFFVFLLITFSYKVLGYYTDSINVGDKLKFTGNSWYVYSSKDAAQNLDKTRTNGCLNNNCDITVIEKSGNVLKISNNKYIYYGSTADKYFKKSSNSGTNITNNNYDSNLVSNSSNSLLGDGIINSLFSITSTGLNTLKNIGVDIFASLFNSNFDTKTNNNEVSDYKIEKNTSEIPIENNEVKTTTVKQDDNKNGSSTSSCSIKRTSVSSDKFNRNSSYPYSKKSGRNWTSYCNNIKGYLKFIEGASKKYNVKADLIMAIIMTESGGNKNAVGKYNGVKYYGLMQVCEKYYKPYLPKGKSDPLDPETNIYTGTNMLKGHLRSSSNETAGISKYAGYGSNTNNSYLKTIKEYRSIINQLYSF